jgi:hypothetical protein
LTDAFGGAMIGAVWGNWRCAGGRTGSHKGPSVTTGAKRPLVVLIVHDDWSRVSQITEVRMLRNLVIGVVLAEGLALVGQSGVAAAAPVISVDA